jgi:hypothetical protein
MLRTYFFGGGVVVGALAMGWRDSAIRVKH